MLYRLPYEEFIEGFAGSGHDGLEFLLLPYGERKAWEGDECVAGSAFEPWVSGYDIVSVRLVDEELVGGGYEGVVEIVAWRAESHFLVEEFLQS